MTEKLCLLSWGEPEDVKLCLVWVNSLKVLSLSKISKSQHLSESAVCVQLAVWGGVIQGGRAGSVFWSVFSHGTPPIHMQEEVTDPPQKMSWAASL